MKKYAEEIGDIRDTRCKQNSIKAITRIVCKNNCTEWDYIKRRCKLGYNMYKKWYIIRQGGKRMKLTKIIETGGLLVAAIGTIFWMFTSLDILWKATIMLLIWLIYIKLQEK